MGTNIYLQSDFIEPYDSRLHDPMGSIRWKRLSRGGRNRREIFKLLDNYVAQTQQFRVHVAPHGTVKELWEKYEEREVDGIWNANWDHTGICSSFSELVIYKDEMAHRGEGKEVVDVEDAIEECPDAYASVLLRNKQDYAISHRDLFIGNHVFKLTYISMTDSWRSNCGHVVITLDDFKIYPEYDKMPFTCKYGIEITSPMYAFDYIDIPVSCSQYPDGSPERFYVDFNEAPGLPDEVVVNKFGSAGRGDLVKFEEVLSFEKIVECIENSLKSER
jgi:hypothetical protein